MKPLNQAERRKAFLNFLLLFTITIAVVIIAVFFSMQVPFAENKKMKTQLNAYRTAQSFEAKFAANMTDPQTLLTRLSPTQTDSADYLNSQVSEMLSRLSALKNSDSTAIGSDNIYAKTLSALYDLNNTKYRLAKFGSQSDDMSKLQQEKESLTQRINDANNYIAQFLSQSGQKPPYRSF